LQYLKLLREMTRFIFIMRNIYNICNYYEYVITISVTKMFHIYNSLIFLEDVNTLLKHFINVVLLKC
jgi:hypothetical protein